jgi:hypothetical protein
MSPRSSYIYWALLLINVAFAAYLVNGWLFAKPVVPLIPSTLLTENTSVKSEMRKLTENSGSKKIAVALASSRASICVENKIVDFFKRVRSERPEIKLYVLVSKNVSDEDVSTLKENLSIDFDVLRMSTDLEEFWEEVSKKYDSEAIMLLSDENNLVASQNLSEIKKLIDSY